MKRNENLIQKIFGATSVGKGGMPLRSNIYGTRGYTPIGQTGSRIFDNERNSPLLGNYAASNTLSGYYEKLSELRGYQLLDISKLAVNFFSDYIINFLADDSNGYQIASILNDEGEIDEVVSERINDILSKDIRIFDYIKDHIQDYVFYGDYYSMLLASKDDEGHTKFRIEELYDPIAVVVKKKRGKDGEMEEVFLAKGDDGSVYEIPKEEIIYLATNNLRLKNDISGNWRETAKPKSIKDQKNREKVLLKESFSASEPLFYSLILKVKELVVKELLVSLISLRDLSSVQIFLLQFDKSVPLETAEELCSKTTKLANATNEVASFLTSQFDVVSFIENTLVQSAKFVPDYNSTIGGKNAMVPLDKLSDKLLDIMQSVDTCRNNVLGPLGLPSTIVDSTSGSKWQVLQQSERANSRVAFFMAGIKDSVTSLVCNIYKIIYGEELNPSCVKLHIAEKTSVEYNNQINQSESINGLLNGLTQVISNALQTLEQASPLIDARAYLSYIHNLLKDIDPNTESIITKDTMNTYLKTLVAKLRNQYEQLGMNPEDIMSLFPDPEEEEQSSKLEKL